MQDPVGAFERIRELYISYLDTAFRIGDESVAEERRLLLRRPGELCTEPLIEPIPMATAGPFSSTWGLFGRHRSTKARAVTACAKVGIGT